MGRLGENAQENTHLKESILKNDGKTPLELAKTSRERRDGQRLIDGAPEKSTRQASKDGGKNTKEKKTRMRHRP